MKRNTRSNLDYPSKDKRRARRRQRNFIAKEMLTKRKTGGPMEDKRKELLQKAEEHDDWYFQNEKDLFDTQLELPIQKHLDIRAGSREGSNRSKDNNGK